MRSRVLIPLLVLAASAALAGLARAAAVDTDRFVYAHDVKLTGSGFDFGGGTLIGGSPSTSGELAWWTEDGEPGPLVEGTLHLNDVEGACARLRLDYKTSAGTTFHTHTTSERCVDDDDHHEFEISTSPYADSKIGKVRITLERLFATGGWTDVDSQTVRFGPYADGVKIAADGVDFGSDAFIGSGPAGTGVLTWSYEDAKVHARLTGTLHTNNVAGTCARIKIDYRDAAGDLLGDDIGGSACPSDNSHDEWLVDLGSFADRDIVEARVRLQTLGADGVWRNAGHDSAWFSSEAHVRW
jgi:hypothetical protein